MGTGRSGRAARPVTAPDPDLDYPPPSEPMGGEGRREGAKSAEEEKGWLRAEEANDIELGELCSRARYAGIQDARRKRRPAIQSQAQGAEGVVDLDAG